ncbi:hypothetical protein M408DRAFT_182418 [Serendipita vermifera MAFF 305830]|uniref:F-box domain-containing protein n=1 Tax=Serendipita vermifera MAFF 305830 TaxID=933852 RepID=A0A0C3AQ00_SERVB|nr:hypothetical protein M408DRAFT_182418 [Serendipita vermifera MAFF 305830]
MNQQRGRAYVNNLPREVIEAIFHFHVIFYRKSRYPLLLTCRKWYNIATTYSTLWKVVALRCQRSLPPDTVLCPNLDALALVINRTGRAHFELFLGESFSNLKLKDVKHFLTSVDRNWLSRCKALTVFSQARGRRTPPKLGEVFFSGGLTSLQYLEIRYHATAKKWESILQPLLEGIENTAFNFRELRVHVTGLLDEEGTTWITQNIYERPNILKRLTKVMLRDTCEPVPWDYFTSIKMIDVWCNDEFSPMVRLDIPLVQHLSLGGVDSPGSLAYPELWRQLTHLTIKDCIEEFGPFNLDLPSLISLSLVACGFNLRHMNVPKLDELAYRVDCGFTNGLAYADLEGGVSFTPRIVHIDINAGNDPEEDWTVFTTMLPLWSKVEEIHLKLIGDDPLLGLTLVNAVSGRSPEGCYPKLHSVTVIYPTPETRYKKDESDGDWVYREAVINEIKSLLEWHPRVDELGPLKRLELGWYVEWGDDYVESEWRVVEWDDCLRW